MNKTDRTADSAATQLEDDSAPAPCGQPGAPRVSLPARSTDDGWQYPEGDSAIVRGED
jgi:hypothetical protein